MENGQDNSGGRRDWRVSATLLAVWIVALIVLSGRRNDIPLSMIAIATLFFVILIPAMNDLVRSIEKSVFGSPDDSAKSRK